MTVSEAQDTAVNRGAVSQMSFLGSVNVDFRMTWMSDTVNVLMSFEFEAVFFSVGHVAMGTLLDSALIY